jgi:hypothetical protein
VSGCPRVLRPDRRHDGDMAKLTDKIAKFARSQRGQRLLRKAEEYAGRPENQRRLAQLRDRLTRRRSQGR